MNWTNEPELNDVLAKKRIRKHNTFGGKVVEILYGAKDENGNPVEAREDAQDGHGRWYGIEADGKYLMFSLTKPASEGGETVLGVEQGDDALALMEDEILKKKELVRAVEDIAREASDVNGQEKLQALKNEYVAMTDWGTPKEAEYLLRLTKAESKFNMFSEIHNANREAKKAILAEAEKLSESKEFKKARSAIRSLMDKMDEIGSAGETDDDEMEDRLHDIERQIRSNERDFYANIETTRAHAKAKKEELIAASKKVLASNKKFKEMGDELNKLFDEWKATANAGKDVDDELWEQFRAVRTEFNEKKNAYFDKMNAEWETSANGKRALIEKAKEIAASNKYTKAVTDEMKQLDVEWKKFGYSGKNLNDALWEEYNAAKKVFWDGKTALHTKAVKADLDVKIEKRARLQKEIEDLKYRLTIEEKPALKEDFLRQIQVSQDKITVLNAEIIVLEDKLNK